MGFRILVADDDPDVVEYVEAALAAEGYEILVAENGEEALRIALAERPDLAIIDIRMPRRDGLAVCRTLRRLARTASLPILLLTARAETAEKTLGLDSGADDYIVKPVAAEELCARVRANLRRSRDLRNVSPLTGLPGNVPLHEELERRVALDVPFALIHVDLDNFKAFNDHYGFLRGDQVIEMTARVLSDAADRHCDPEALLGHIGGDDFALICHADTARPFAEEVIARFDEEIGAFYDPADLGRGSILVPDRQGLLRPFPIMTISLGIAWNRRRILRSAAQASEIAGELKIKAKSNQASSYAVDRRTDGEGANAVPSPRAGDEL